jgi:hypothetical protein
MEWQEITAVKVFITLAVGLLRLPYSSVVLSVSIEELTNRKSGDRENKSTVAML